MNAVPRPTDASTSSSIHAAFLVKRKKTNPLKAETPLEKIIPPPLSYESKLETVVLVFFTSTSMQYVQELVGRPESSISFLHNQPDVVRYLQQKPETRNQKPGGTEGRRSGRVIKVVNFILARIWIRLGVRAVDSNRWNVRKQSSSRGGGYRYAQFSSYSSSAPST